ncbi:MAG: TIGR03009 domain-containing protein [Gemmataceae bacterium]|nr:TIGR03009 domain-containing protein [Gemmataceae bacterium]
MSGVAVYAILLALPDPRLAAHLAAWEKATQGVTNVRAVFELTRIDAVLKKERKFTGAFLHLRPRSTRLRLQSTANPADYDAYICDGERKYLYNGLAKTITELPVPDRPRADVPPVELPPDAPEWARRFLTLLSAAYTPESNVALYLLTGPPAGELGKRYSASLVKEDANYVYLDLRPRTEVDRLLVTRVRVAVYGPNAPAPHHPYTPAQVHLTKPNGDTELWTFTEVKHNLPDIDPAKFKFENVPGYTLQRALPAAGKKP